VHLLRAFPWQPLNSRPDRDFPAAGSVEAVSESLTSFYLLVRVEKINAAWIFWIHESAFQL
jgi:hypothetical protein